MKTSSEILRNLGLAKNEAIIYETLLKSGETTVAYVSRHARIERRNVYDSLKRLIEKGLVYETVHKSEKRYQAVDPQKLCDDLDETRRELLGILPALKSLYQGATHREEIFLYRGVEGYKNEMRDILRAGEDFYSIGGKAIWLDPRLRGALEEFNKEAKRKNIKFHFLFEPEVGKHHSEVASNLGDNYKILPSDCSANALVDIFGDHVIISSPANVVKIDENVTKTVIVNPIVADAFRAWFKLIWRLLPKA